MTLLFHTWKKITQKKVLSQINAYIETYFSDHLASFQKSLSPQHCLIKILETIKFPLDNWDDTVTVFMNLSKPFQALNRSQLLSTLDMNGFSLSCTTFIQSLLNERIINSLSIVIWFCWRIFIVGCHRAQYLLIPLQFFHQWHFQRLSHLWCL